MLRLIIVDDEEIIRNALTKIVDYNSIGYELIGTAKNGMEAYDLICDSYPDVIITDIKMPILSGLDLIAKSISLNAGIDYIILSGFGEFDLAKQAMKFGVQNYILKPTNKDEVIKALIDIKERRYALQQNLINQQNQILQQTRFPIEECFFIECLEQLQSFSSCYEKYNQLLHFPKEGVQACICSFIEERHLSSVVADIHNFLTTHHIKLLFPIISVKNNLILAVSIDALTLQSKLQKNIEDMNYPDQSVSFSVNFLHSKSTHDLFYLIIKKISRYSQIHLIDSTNVFHEMRNNLTSSWKLKDLSTKIVQSKTKNEIKEHLTTLFSPISHIEASKNLAISLFIWLDSSSSDKRLDLACFFFKKIYSCDKTSDIISLLYQMITNSFITDTQQCCKTKATIDTLKSYVIKHLGEEKLSLKWISENYLYVSVGYLSKQFIKEEGLRFSDYLNGIRMEEAKRFLQFYNNDSIKTIARQVGFGNNPQYFSQVFKRYTGITPSEYIEQYKSLAT